MTNLDAKESIKISDKTVQEAPQEKEKKFIGGMRKRKGLKLYAFNLASNTLEEAKPSETITELTEQRHLIYGFKTGRQATITQNKYKFDEDIIYIQALNKKNALKKVNKALKRV